MADDFILEWDAAAGELVGIEPSTGNQREIPLASLIAQEIRIRDGRGFLGLPNHHINYENGLSDEEVARFTLDAGQVLEVWRLEVKLKGGGTNSSFDVDVYDASAGSIIASTSNKAVGGDSPVGSSTDGATIIVRISNSTGTSQDACISGITDIVNA